jgi:transposase
MDNPFRLTVVRMARLQPFFPKSHGKPRVDDRRVLGGIIFIKRNGLRWCDAPPGRMVRRLTDRRPVATRYTGCPRIVLTAEARAAVVMVRR